MKVAIAVGVTPIEPLMIQAHMLAESIEQNSGLNYEIVWVWPESYKYENVVEEYPWIKNYPHKAVGVPEKYAKALSWVANFMYRFELEYDADVVIIADSDTLVWDDLNAICSFAYEDKSLLGVTGGTFVNEAAERCFKHFNMPIPNYDLTFMPWGIWTLEESMRYVPPHYNCGVLYTVPENLKAISSTVFSDMVECKTASKHPLFTQLGPMISFIKHGVSCKQVNLKYNMTAAGGVPRLLDENNGDAVMRNKMAKDALENPKFLHYCVKTERVNKSIDFVSYDSLEAFLQKPSGSSFMAKYMKEFIGNNLEKLKTDAGK